MATLRRFWTILGALLLLMTACSPDPAAIDVHPPFIKFNNLKRSVTLDISVQDENGRTMAHIDPQLKSSDPSVVRIEGKTVIPVGSGEAVVTAQHENLTNQCHILVELADKLQPPSKQMKVSVGDSFDIKPKILNEKGNEISYKPMIFYSMNPDLVSITPSGMATALSPGKTTVVAIYLQLRAEIGVEITPAEQKRR